MRLLITVGLTLLVICLWGALIWSQTRPSQATSTSASLKNRTPALSGSGASGSQSTLNADAIGHGFVFIDGRYVEAPYRIEVKETHVLLNGKYVLLRRDSAASLPSTSPSTRESEDAADSAGLIRGLLLIDSCLFFDADGELHTSLGADRVASSFEVAIEILQSNRPVGEKISLLQEAGVLHAGEFSKTPELVTNFQPNAQLLERVKWLAQVRDAKPLEIQDLKTR